MKIAIFDVSNGNCALAVCTNGNSIMFDCGSHEEKDCPVERINGFRMSGSWLAHMQNYITPIGISYPLTKLVISHPDTDHIKNIEKVHTKFTPYVLHRRYIEDFPVVVAEQEDDSYKYYKDKVDAIYRTTVPSPVWNFIQKSYEIPMNILKTNELFGESKLKNNSSIIYLLEYNGFRILFGGDMEEVGWDWLIDNNHSGFKDELAKGIDFIVVSHHGHTSGYSQKLMDLIGSPKLAILSKGSETGDETDVDSRYSAQSEGFPVIGLSEKNTVNKKTITTRSNGSIYIDVGVDGKPTVYADLVS